jgi:hypothetical protein
VYLVSTGAVALLFEAEDPLDLVARMEPATDDFGEPESGVVRL